MGDAYLGQIEGERSETSTARWTSNLGMIQLVARVLAVRRRCTNMTALVTGAPPAFPRTGICNDAMAGLEIVVVDKVVLP
jgi:hypothetical protein